jgi:hypothetical protein
VKKQTISRKDAKAQRLAKNNSVVLFAPSAALRLGVKCFCSFRNFSTLSKGYSHFRLHKGDSNLAEKAHAGNGRVTP